MKETKTIYDSELLKLSTTSEEYIKEISTYKEDKFMELLINFIKIEYEIEILDIYINDGKNRLERYNELKKEYLYNSKLTREEIRKNLEEQKEEILSVIILLYSSILFMANNPSNYGFALINTSISLLLSYKISIDYLTSNCFKNKCQKKLEKINNYISIINDNIYFYEELKKIYQKQYNVLDKKTDELEPPRLDNETEEEYNNRVISMYQEVFKEQKKVKRRKRNDR